MTDEKPRPNFSNVCNGGSSTAPAAPDPTPPPSAAAPRTCSVVAGDWLSRLRPLVLLPFAALLLFTPVLGTVAQEGGAPAAALSGAVGETQTGLAAVYSRRLNGHRTASGERYNSKALTAAHQTLPFGTKVKVTHLKTNKSVIVRINDRGPKQAGRILDLSRHAADSLGIHHGRHGGLAEVKLEVVKAAKK